jgi:hypothetical protein
MLAVNTKKRLLALFLCVFVISFGLLIAAECENKSSMQSNEVDYRIPVEFSWNKSSYGYKLSGVMCVGSSVNGKRKIKLNMIAESPFKGGKQDYAYALMDEGYIRVCGDGELLSGYWIFSYDENGDKTDQCSSSAWLDSNKWRGIEFGFSRDSEEEFSYKMILDLQFIVKDEEINSDTVKLMCGFGSDKLRAISLKNNS